MSAFRTREFQRLPDIELEDTEYDSKEPKKAFRVQVQTISDPFRQHGRRYRFFERNRRYLWLSLPLTGAVIWSAMIIYFYLFFVTLPRLNGKWPRIGFSYATFPFISCIGAVKLTYFRAFSGAVAFFNITTFALNFYLMRRIHIGRFCRWLKMLAAFNGSLFLVLLSIYSVNSSNRLHLIFTSIQIMSTGLTKTFDSMETFILMRIAQDNPYIKRTRFIKRAAVMVAGPSSVLAIIGIYGCRDALVVLSPGTTCNKLVEIAAPAEWILAGCWAIYLFAVSMEMYNMDVIRDSLLLQIEKHNMAATQEAQSLLKSH